VLGSGRRDAERVLNRLRGEILLKPIARLTQPGLAAQIVNLQMQLCLFVCWCCCHDYLSFWFA